MEALALFVGMGTCNARCERCAGKIHRRYAPKRDGIVDEMLITQTLRSCFEDGARRLTITGSGEPTLSPRSVTKVLEIAYILRDDGIVFSPIHMYSNGIIIGTSHGFCGMYLNAWKDLGLSAVYVTVHGADRDENARGYRVKNYPPLYNIVRRIHRAGLFMRANVVLEKGSVDNAEKALQLTKQLHELGVDAVSMWPIRNIANDEMDTQKAPDEKTLQEMRAEMHAFNQALGIEFVKVYGEENHLLYTVGKKMTLFPDGTLSGSWCN